VCVEVSPRTACCCQKQNVYIVLCKTLKLDNIFKSVEINIIQIPEFLKSTELFVSFYKACYYVGNYSTLTPVLCEIVYASLI